MKNLTPGPPDAGKTKLAGVEELLRKHESLSPAEKAIETFIASNFDPAAHREALHELFTHWLMFPHAGTNWGDEQKNQMHYSYLVIRDLLSDAVAIHNAAKAAQP